MSQMAHHLSERAEEWFKSVTFSQAQQQTQSERATALLSSLGLSLKNTTSHSPILVAALVGIVTFLTYLVFVPPRNLNGKNGVKVIGSWPFAGLGSREFFGNRYTFLSEHMTKDPRHPLQGLIKFNLTGKVVYTLGTTDVAVLKEVALHPDLSFSQGNNFLFAGIAGASQKGLIEGEMDKQERQEMKMLAAAISPQRLNSMRPALVQDAINLLDDWVGGPSGQSSTVDLQQAYYPLIFRYTVRLMGMTEYATDSASLKKLMNAFWATQLNSGFFTTVMPWLPQPRLIKRIVGAVTLWRMVKVTLDQRIKKQERFDDFAQILIDQKQSTAYISRFVIGGLMAGILNTIGTGAYTIAFVGASSSLQATCRSELIAGLRAAAAARGDDYDELSTAEKLDRVKLEEWEAGFSTLHACFKETIRLLLTNSLNRYYPGPGRDSKGVLRDRLKIMGHEIEDDAYIIIPPSCNLHDADMFPEPWAFDPSRYQRGEGANEYTYLGWGCGRHKCTGMRFAKLETIIALSTVLLTFDIQTVDDKGKSYDLKSIPLPDLSQSHWRAPTRPMRLQVHRRKQ
ncbi:Cytochrome P450 [Ceraceosorus bombacis]|uniref:Cytochrome P450 n=1 Tax=Ceraceosorus bombacis TaxID=401625 RepID=A0A0P1BN47_9BASI|nr:Cytochrome P450 [Ceraceosorus bombacis]